jgi:hypothetical protein
VIIDCDKCVIRGVGCKDCVISVLLDAPEQLEFDEPELRAFDALAEAGLVPRLRLIPIHPRRDFVAESIDTPELPLSALPSAERSATDDGRQHRQVG